LADDYTNIQRLVFVDGDKDRRYVGMTSPTVVRKELANFGGLDLESVYQHAKQAVGQPEHSQAQRVVFNWIVSQFIQQGKTVNEKEAKTSMSTELVMQLIMLETDSVELNQPLDSPRFQALVLEKNARYVPLTLNGRLAQVVNADAFARDIATKTLH